jgi:hypothetical protein
LRIYVLIALMLALYLFPWLVNPAASLTPNAYDLAEWASLHPAVRDANFLTSFLLRLPLACLALIVAFTGTRSALRALVVVVLSVAVLRPEFFTALGDPNYQQQAGLAAFALVGGIVGLSGILKRWHAYIAMGIGIVGAAACIVGVNSGYGLMRGFRLPTQVGIGGVGLALAFGGVTLAYVVVQVRQRRNRVARRMLAAVNGTGQL